MICLMVGISFFFYRKYKSDPMEDVNKSIKKLTNAEQLVLDIMLLGVQKNKIDDYSNHINSFFDNNVIADDLQPEVRTILAIANIGNELTTIPKRDVSIHLGTGDDLFVERKTTDNSFVIYPKELNNKYKIRNIQGFKYDNAIVEITDKWLCDSLEKEKTDKKYYECQPNGGISQGSNLHLRDKPNTPPITNQNKAPDISPTPN